MVRQQRIAAQMKPLAIELFVGLHGWGAGFAAAGFRVVGFDIANMGKTFGAQTPDGCQLVIQDVLTLHGSQFRDAAVIVASPPCQNYSYLAMPWSRSKDPNNSKAAKALRLKWETEGPDNRLFDACFRIQREAMIARTHDCCSRCSGPHHCCRPDCYPQSPMHVRYIPLIVENVRGAQPWVGRSAWNYGSFHLWGDVPALMPITLKRGQKASHLTCPSENAAKLEDGTKQAMGRGDWFSKEARDGGAAARFSSKSNARKMASAMIAKIPRELAEHIARVYYPQNAKTAQP